MAWPLPALGDERAPSATASTVAPDADVPVPAPIEPPPISEVTVRGKSSVAAHRRSAEAVDVVDLKRAQRETADLGEVLARTQGVAVRRGGGLGSPARFSLNGLYDDQIRFYLDGVPLELAGFPNGIANVPVNLIARAEVYRGVLPIRFGADALGGAVDLVTNPRYDDQLSASYQVGSFGLRRFTLDGRVRHRPSGLYAGVSAFADVATNDYPIDVLTPDAQGRPRAATVKRFHDRYEAYGGAAEVGFLDKPWAKRLLLKVFGSWFDKELQHNTVMTVPYGDARYGGASFGGTLRHDVPIARNVDLELLLNQTRRWIRFEDAGVWVYDWFGHRLRQRPIAGEISGVPRDQRQVQDTTLGRAVLNARLTEDHILRAAIAPTFTHRTGEERIRSSVTARDPLGARRELFTLVSGLEWEANLFRERPDDRESRLQNIVFAKDYLYLASSQEVLADGSFGPVDRSSHTLGVGDGVRWRFGKNVYAKASYELATRLPRPDEAFGDGVLIVPNLGIEPEVSHNGNLGPHLEWKKTPIGDLVFDLNGFLRDSRRLIVLLGNAQTFQYQNVYRARTLGLENALAWSSPRRWLSLDGTFTWQDARNASSQGAFGAYDGDRIPNRPWLFASWGARVIIPRFFGPDDTLEPFYRGRYTHGFFRGWESQGLREYKQVVDAQASHDLGVTWNFARDLARLSSTLEVQNVGNARLYDVFGVQRPGRGIYFKVTAEL